MHEPGLLGRKSFSKGMQKVIDKIDVAIPKADTTTIKMYNTISFIGVIACLR